MAEAVPRIAITPGEPAGCGPDLIIKLAENPFPAELVIISDPNLLQQRATMLGADVQISLFDPSKPAIRQQQNQLSVLPVTLSESVTAGKLDHKNAEFVLQTLNLACDGCMNNTFAAMTTGPVQKSIINDAGIAFSGHTEYLAARCNHAYPVMLLANQRCKVALVTTHLPLSKVSDVIDQNMLIQTIEIVEHDLRNRFGLSRPKILVCGLNPHAGESGHMGQEEITIINPVIEKLSANMDIIGPLPADTVFTPQWLDQGDVVVSMFHDQGLPALKALGFGETINITLGLPIIRTSVDHGTALDLAGSGRANPGSLKAAIDLAIELAGNQR